MHRRQIRYLLPALLFCTVLFMTGCASQQAAQPKIIPTPITGSKPELSGLPGRLSREGTLVYSFRDQQAAAFDTVAWSPDGKRIASLDSRDALHIWDALTGKHPVAYHMNEAFVPIPFVWSPDSTHIAYIDQKLVRILDVRTGRTVLTYSGHRDDVEAIAWSPNGRYVASAGGIADKTVQVWDSQSGKTIYTYRGHTGAIFSIAWSPDSTRIASNSSAFDIHVWDALTGGNVSILAVPHSAQTMRIAALAWSPDGTRIAASHGGGVDIMNAVTGKDVLSYHGYSDYDTPYRLL